MKKYTGPKDRSSAASDPTTSVDELSSLASSEYIFVREAVAANANSTSVILEALVPRSFVKEDDFRIAAGLLSNPSLPSTACISLVGSISTAISKLEPRNYHAMIAIERLFAHPSAPIASLAELLRNKAFPQHLRGRIACENSRMDVLNLLKDDLSENVRKRAPNVLERKAHS